MKVDLKGWNGIEEALVEIEKVTGKTTQGRALLRRAAIKAMKPIEERAKQFAPKDDGTLAESITTKQAKAKRVAGSKKFERQSGVEVLTGPTGRPAGGNAAWQEYGTVNMPAHPFMRPAADAEGPGVVATVVGIISTEIDRTAKRLARKAAKGK